MLSALPPRPLPVPTLTRARFIVQADGTNTMNCAAPATDPALSQQYRGRIGQYTVTNNCMAEQQAFVSAVDEIGLVDGPNVVLHDVSVSADCQSRPPDGISPP